MSAQATSPTPPPSACPAPARSRARGSRPRLEHPCNAFVGEVLGVAELCGDASTGSAPRGSALVVMSMTACARPTSRMPRQPMISAASNALRVRPRERDADAAVAGDARHSSPGLRVAACCAGPRCCDHAARDAVASMRLPTALRGLPAAGLDNPAQGTAGGDPPLARGADARDRALARGRGRSAQVAAHCGGRPPNASRSPRTRPRLASPPSPSSRRRTSSSTAARCSSTSSLRPPRALRFRSTSTSSRKRRATPSRSTCSTRCASGRRTSPASRSRMRRSRPFRAT